MKNIILSISALLLLLGCNKEKSGFTATIDGVVDSTNVYISKLGKNNQPVSLDTVQVIQGGFHFDMEQDEPQQITVIRIDGVPKNLFFVYENEPMNASLYKDSLRSSEVVGGKHNKLLMTYMDTLKSNAMKMREIQIKSREAILDKDNETLLLMKQEEKKLQESDLAFRKKIALNSNSIVGALSLSDLINNKKLNNEEIKSIYDSFSDEVKDHTFGRTINETIAKMTKTDVGATALPFEAPTPEGEMLSLDKAMGKLTLIDFWASWCKPCRMENPNVVSVYNEYKDKGFNIISVSLDKNKSSWERAIEQDNMDWYHVSNLKYWSEPIAKDWGVRSIPATFLIDEKGIILAKNLRGSALRKKVDEFLSN
jgi:thiol-disulfide isomerase/thioredoxin